MEPTINFRISTIAGSSAEFPVKGCYDDKSIRTKIEQHLGVPAAQQSLVYSAKGTFISDDDWVDEADDTFSTIIEGLRVNAEEVTLDLILTKRDDAVVMWLQRVKDCVCESEEMRGAPESVRSSKEVFLALARSRQPDFFQYATEELKADREFVLQLIRRTGEVLEVVSDSLKSDEEVVLAAVKSSNGSALKFADASLKASTEFAWKAVRAQGNALGYVRAELQKDRSLALEAVKNDGSALGWAFHFQDDREVVLTAVSRNGDALQMADESLQADREIVQAAVINGNGFNALGFAADELKNDKDFAFGLVLQKKYAIRHVGKAVTEDRSCMMDIVCLGEQCDPDDMKGDPGFCPLEYASLELRSDKALVLKAVWHNGYNFQFAADHLKADREVALHAMKSPVGWRVWECIPPSLHQDKVFALDVSRLEGRVREEFTPLFSDDELSQFETTV